MRGGVNLNSKDQWRFEIKWPGSIKENGVEGGCRLLENIDWCCKHSVL